MKKFIVLASIAAFALSLAAVPFVDAAKVHVINGSENFNDIYAREQTTSNIGVFNTLRYSGTTIDVSNTGGNVIMGEDVTAVKVYTGGATLEIDEMTDLETTKITNEEAANGGGSDILVDNCCAEGGEDCVCGGSEENMNRVITETDDTKDTAIVNDAKVENFDLGVTNAGLNVLLANDDVCDVEVVTGDTYERRGKAEYVQWTEVFGR